MYVRVLFLATRVSHVPMCETCGVRCDVTFDVMSVACVCARRAWVCAPASCFDVVSCVRVVCFLSLIYVTCAA